MATLEEKFQTLCEIIQNLPKDGNLIISFNSKKKLIV